MIKFIFHLKKVKLLSEHLTNKKYFCSFLNFYLIKFYYLVSALRYFLIN